MEQKILTWCEEIYKNMTGDKSVVLIAGASSSGKSHNAQELCEYFKSVGKSSFVLSADDYYKGLTMIIFQKALQNLNDIKTKYFQNNQDFQNGYKIIRNIIENKDFSLKFDSNTIKMLNQYFDYMGKEDKLKFIKELRFQFESIDFDQPFCIDFKLLASHIATFNQRQKFIKPYYSFKTSEATFNQENLVNSNIYDYLIVEGIFVLRDELLKLIDNKRCVKTFIDCDLKTLLSRKFNRDITFNRSTFTPEQTVTSFITKVLPAYYQNILQTKTNANIIYNASITEKEVNDRKENLQIKFKIDDNSHQLITSLGYVVNKIEKQTDYFLESEGSDKMFVRLRCENNLATTLNIKVKKGKFKTSNDQYDLTDFSLENRNIENLIENFKKSGFSLYNMLEKNRYFYQKDNLIIKYDKTPFGDFVEVGKDEVKHLKQIKKYLSRPIDNSYYDISRNDFVFAHNEVERKYLLKGDINLDNFESKKIQQYYFDINKHKSLLNEIFKKSNDGFDDYSEMRIRVINNKKAILTLKSKGHLVRKELEKQVPLQTLNDIKNDNIGVISKTRYQVYENEFFDATVDKYNDKYILEVEYHDFYADKLEDVVKKVLKSLGNVKAEDVTNKSQYKNVNLARKNYEQE